MLGIKEKIVEDLKRITKDLSGQDIEPRLEHPSDERHGDYSTNVALTLFANSKLKTQNSKLRTPMELAQRIASSYQSIASSYVEKVEAVKPGFINFWLSKNYLTTLMTLIIKAKDEYGKSKRLANEKIMIEFTDPNPFKEFHIGHLYSNTVGESISRLLEASGAIVKRANYQGDVGLHVAKSLYAIFQISNFKFQISNLEKRPAKERAEFLGKCYAFGAKAYEDDEKANKAIEKLNKKIYDKDPTITALYEKGRQWSLEYFEEIYKRLGTKFDFYYFESEVGKDGLELVKKYFKKGVFEKSKGAIIFPGEKHARLAEDGESRRGLHNRVFINSLGLPTYEAKELGLTPRKYRDFNYDKSIIITGNEIIGYFKVVLAALGKINPDLAAKTKHLSHGMVKLPSGKMSSRTGNILTGEWLLNETKKLLKSKYREMTEDTLEKVAVGSVKYALLKSSIGHDIEFNFEESINIQGNSGPYLQYTFARTESVLRKAQNANFQLPTSNFQLEPEEVSVLRAIYRFPEVVEEAGEKFAPNLLCNYLFDLAQKFNLFYQRVPIIKKQRQDKSLGANVKHLGGVKSVKREFRLSLTMAVGQIIKNGLYLLGIKAPERM